MKLKGYYTYEEIEEYAKNNNYALDSGDSILSLSKKTSVIAFWKLGKAYALNRIILLLNDRNIGWPVPIKPERLNLTIDKVLNNLQIKSKA